MIHLRSVELLSVTLLVILTVALFVPVLSAVVNHEIDYGMHFSFAQALLNGMSLDEFLAVSPIPHFLYELLIITTYRLLPDISLTDAGLLVSLVFYVFLAVVIYGLLRSFVGRPINFRMSLTYGLATLTMTLVAPITLFTPRNQYFGYIAMNVYHSPTMVLLKPIAVPLFFMAGKTFGSPQVDRWKSHFPLCALIAVLCVLTKPSYAIVIAPTLVVWLLHSQLKNHVVDRFLLIGGILVPTVITLGFLALSFRRGGDIALAPLAVFHEWDRIYNPNASSGLALKFLLSTLFPLSVSVMYFREALHDTYLNFAWMGFAFGAAYTYLLVETDRIAHGNFIWSGQIALFVLFLVSLMFFLRENWLWIMGDPSGKLTPRFLIAISVLALHLVSGIVWYLAHASGMPTSEMLTSLW